MNKKKKSTNTSPYPDEAIDRLARAFYPAILACWNSEEGQRSLVGARPLHLANARPFGRLKAPLGLSLLRCAAQTRACRVAGGAGLYLWQRKTGSSRWGTPCLTYRVWIFQGASYSGRTLFFVLYKWLSSLRKPKRCYLRSGQTQQSRTRHYHQCGCRHAHRRSFRQRHTNRGSHSPAYQEPLRLC